MQINKIETFNNNKIKTNKNNNSISFSSRKNFFDEDKFVKNKKEKSFVQEESFIDKVKKFVLSVLSINKFAQKEKNPRDKFIEKINKELLVKGSKVVHRFTKLEIKNLVKLYDKEPEIIEHCVDLRQYDGVRPMLSFELINDYYDLLQRNRDFVKKAIFSNNENHSCYYLPKEIEKLLDNTKEKNLPYVQELFNDCFSSQYITFLEGKPDFDKRVKLIKEGFSPNELPQEKIKDYQFNQMMSVVENQKKNPATTRYFLGKIGKDDKLKNNTYSKYQDEVYSLIENMTNKTKFKLIKSKFTEEDFYKAVADFSKSIFKIAYDNPSYYLNENVLEDFENKKFKKTQIEQIEKAQKRQIKAFFKTNMATVLRALRYIDKDTISHLMDKKFDYFNKKLNEFDTLTNENYELLSKLLKLKKVSNGKNLSPNERLDLCYVMYVVQLSKIDTKIFDKYIKNNEIDIDEIKQLLKNIFLERIDIDVSKIKDKEKLNFNKEFVHLLLMFPKEDENKNQLLNLIIEKSVKGNFKEYIVDLSNRFGVANARTKKIFLDRHLDYENWVNPNMEQREIKIGDKKLKLQMWERKPQEDLFLGNKTTCCTGISTGTNQDAILEYLLSTAFNVVEIRDERNKVVGMARLFMAELNNKEIAMAIDTIEVNNTFAKGLSDKEEKELRNELIKYINDFNKKIIPCYQKRNCICSLESKLSIGDFPIGREKFKFLGKPIGQSVYINIVTNWCRQRELDSIYTNYHIIH